jgi:Suppressor of fused protein (SUFU)
MSAYSETVSESLVSVLDVIARELDERHRPLLRGQLIGPRGSVLPESCLEAFIAMNPWYWDDEFSYFGGVDPPIYVVWLIPITRREAEYVMHQGIDAFEAMIDDQDPDLLDLHRNSMSL